MQIVCLDLEGVLVPEIWIAFSQRTAIPAFSRTVTAWNPKSICLLMRRC